jgi:hypothetical protein
VQAEADFFTPARMLVLFLAICGILVLRDPQWVRTPTFFAESGAVFYREQLLYGFRAILRPYNGYLHPIMRTAAFIESVVPTRFAAGTCVLIGIVIQAGSYASLLWPGFRYLVRSDRIRLAAALVLAVALPANEMIGNCLNTHWHVMLPGMLLLFLPNGAEAGRYRLRSSAAGVLSAAVCLAAAPMMILLPFAVWRMLKCGGRERIIAAAAVPAFLLQLSVLVASPHTMHSASAAGTVLLVAKLGTGTLVAWVYRTLFTMTLGQQLARRLSLYPNPGWFLAALLATAALLTWLAVRTNWHYRRMLLLGGYISVVSIAASLYTRDLLDWFQTVNMVVQFDAARYFMSACYVLIGLAAVALDRTRRISSDWMKAAMLLLVFLGGAAGNFRNLQYPIPNWRDYAPAVQRWRERRNAPASQLEIPIAPKPWVLSLPARGATDLHR